MSGRTCRGRRAGALRKRLLAGQIIFKAFFPMDQAGQTCDDDFGRTEFVKPLTKLRKLRFIPEAVFPGCIRQKACFRDIGRNDVCQRNQATQLLTVFWCDRAIGLSVTGSTRIVWQPRLFWSERKEETDRICSACPKNPHKTPSNVRFNCFHCSR